MLINNSAFARCFVTSHYGFEAGSRTASGRKLAVNGHIENGEHVFGAAHRTLPFGTKLRLKGPNGKIATIVINDRGPFIRRRTLDIVTGGAKYFGMGGVGNLCEVF